MRTAKTADGAAILAPKTKNSKPETQKSFRASKQPAKKLKPVPPPPIPAGLKKPAPAASEKINLESVLYTMLFSLRDNAPTKARVLHVALAGEASFREVYAALARLESVGNAVRVDDSVARTETTWRVATAADNKAKAEAEMKASKEADEKLEMEVQDAALEASGMLAMAGGYCQWQAQSGCEPEAEEAGAVAHALQRMAVRHGTLMDRVCTRLLRDG